MSLIAKLKKVFGWLTSNFTDASTFLWLPIITLMDIHDKENPDIWDYCIGIFMYVTIITIIVIDIITYRKKSYEKIKEIIAKLFFGTLFVV